MKNLLVTIAMLFTLAAPAQALEIGEWLKWKQNANQIGCTNIEDAIDFTRRRVLWANGMQHGSALEPARKSTCKIIGNHPDWTIVDKTIDRAGQDWAWVCLKPVGYESPCYWIHLPEK